MKADNLDLVSESKRAVVITKIIASLSFFFSPVCISIPLLITR
jgi:hypothetical protein